MARVTAQIKGLKILARTLNKYPERLYKGLQLTIQANALEMRDNARAGAPVDTSNLQGSIREDFSEINQLRASVFTALEYARAQEYGYTDTVQVREHTRTITEAFGKPLDGPQTVNVSAHTRRMDIPGNYYMTMAAAYQRKKFRQSIIDAVKRAGRQ